MCPPGKKVVPRTVPVPAELVKFLGAVFNESFCVIISLSLRGEQILLPGDGGEWPAEEEEDDSVSRVCVRARERTPRRKKEDEKWTSRRKKVIRNQRGIDASSSGQPGPHHSRITSTLVRATKVAIFANTSSSSSVLCSDILLLTLAQVSQVAIVVVVVVVTVVAPY